MTLLGRLTGRELAERLRSLSDVDAAVADAMIAVPRHHFVRWHLRWRAYEDRSLPTGPGTSISQPTYIARVLSHARVQRGDRVLEIGTGSGYTAAVLARLGREVVTVECVPALEARARRRLAHLANVRVLLGRNVDAVDGTFDAILVMAGGTSIPAAYTDRLRENGRLVIPVADRPGAVHCQVTRVTRRGGDLVRETLFPGDWNTLVD